MKESKHSRFVGFERLKQSVSMEQVLQRYGLLEQLRRSGESLSGVCPVHRGHNPTQFRVNLSKNCWICFGDCHTGGSIIDFVARMEGITVREAGLCFHIVPRYASPYLGSSEDLYKDSRPFCQAVPSYAKVYKEIEKPTYQSA